MALQAVAVAVLVALVGIFAHGLRSNSTTVAAELNDGKAPAAPGFTLPTLDACPVRLGPRALGVRPCAFGSLGLLRAWGDAKLQSETHSRLYGAAGVALWLGWRVSEVFEIIADGRVGAPFRRDEFAFNRAVFFKTPTPGFSVGLGVAGGFP